jgi:hypothetical protein
MSDWRGIAVMIGAFDEHRSGRKHLLYRTCRTAREAFPYSVIYVVDNGSTGEDAELAKRIAGMFDGIRYRNVGVGKDGNRSSGRLANERMRIISNELRTASGSLPSAVVLSDADAWWKADAECRLRTVWECVLECTNDLGPELALLSGYLEPVWHWNDPEGVMTYPAGVDVAQETVLLRKSTPGVGMSFLLDDRARGPGEWFRAWLAGGEAPFEETNHYDYNACTRVAESGLLVGQMDLLDHTGWGFSGWGNNAIETALPLDRERWGMQVK